MRGGEPGQRRLDRGRRPGEPVEVWAGEALDAVTLARSFCQGAVHQALGWVWSEGIALDDQGVPVDLTIRSFGILSARETPAMDVTLHPGSALARATASDAVFCGNAAGRGVDCTTSSGPQWPTRRVRTRATVDSEPAPVGPYLRPCGAPDPGSSCQARSGDVAIPRTGRLLSSPGRHGGRAPPSPRPTWPPSWAARGSALADVVKTTVFLPRHGRLRRGQRGVDGRSSMSPAPTRSAVGRVGPADRRTHRSGSLGLRQRRLEAAARELRA